jgi:hypothetical protein
LRNFSSVSGGLGNAACIGVAIAMLLLLPAIAGADPRQTDLQSTGIGGGNGAFDVTFSAVSQDGSRTFFTTSEPMVPADTDTAEDLYMRANGFTTLISIGPTGGNSNADNALFNGISNDGAYVFFSTTEQLTANDTDATLDAYQWNAGTLTLVTIGPAGGNGAVDAFYLDNSDDGTKVWFDSTEKLTSDDTDASYQDVYQSSSGTVTRASTGPSGGNGAFHAFFLGHSTDGSHVMFQTGESMVAGDTDGGFQDVYTRAGGTTTLDSGPGNAAFDASFSGATPDASRIYFTTREQLLAGDTDTSRDLYEYAESGGVTTRVSTGPNGGNGAFNVFFAGVSQDGSKVWFETREPIVASDTDAGCKDALGNPTLTCTDVYERSGGSTSLVSCCGNGAFEAFFSGSSLDGSKVFFRTGESLAPGDTDGGFQDIDQRAGGVTTLISTGPAGGSGGHDAFFGGNSNDGARVFFQTNESLVAGDTDGGYQDVYERYAGGTTQISTGPTGTNAGVIANYDANTPDGTVVLFDTGEQLTGADTDQSVDLYSSLQTAPGFPRPKGATPAVFSLVPAYAPCVGGANTHGGPLAYPSCTTPVQDSAVLTIGSPDANAHPAASTSSLKLKTINGAPGPPEDSNVQLLITVNDVLCRAVNAACPGGALSDFAGKVLITFSVRITDRLNGSPAAEGATMQDVDIQIPLQCVATAAINEGGRCTTNTMINAIYPGLALDTKRANWEIGQVRVLDPGPNGTGFDSGCPSTCGDGDETVFMRQGIFVP